MESQGITEWGYELKNSNVHLTLHHGFIPFTIMENQYDTERG